MGGKEDSQVGLQVYKSFIISALFAFPRGKSCHIGKFSFTTSFSFEKLGS